MKKLIIIFGLACISASVIAQQKVRIGNIEIIARKQEQDTTIQVNVPNQSDNKSDDKSQTKSKPNYRYNYSSAFVGGGVIVNDLGKGIFPERENGYYSILGGSSVNFDFGCMNRQQFARWFALVGTLNYSFYNYKLYDAAQENDFNEKILRNANFAPDDLIKQVYRSHNASVGVFTRFYLAKPERRSNRGVFIDLGVQGDVAFNRYCKVKGHSGFKEYYRNDYIFNPYTASYVARIGLHSFSIYARYRFTDAFNAKQLPVDLPPLTIGINFL